MNTAEKITQKLDLDWKPHYRTQKTPDVDTESVIQVLDKKRSYKPENIFQNGEEPCPEAEGYKISYLLVKDLIKDKSTSLEKIPEIESNELGSWIEEIINRALNN
jgi:hypothetical protein